MKALLVVSLWCLLVAGEHLPEDEVVNSRTGRGFLDWATNGYMANLFSSGSVAEVQTLPNTYDTFCASNGEVAPSGSCVNLATCMFGGGVATSSSNTCGTFDGVCCSHRLKCGDTMSSRLAYWESEEYPSLSSRSSGGCTLTVTPLRNICYLRVEFEDMVLPSPRSGICEGNTFSIRGQAEGSSGVTCGNLNGYETLIRVTEGMTGLVRVYDQVALHLDVQDDRHKFRTRISQIPCDQILDTQVRVGLGTRTYRSFDSQLSTNTKQQHISSVAQETLSKTKYASAIRKLMSLRNRLRDNRTSTADVVQGKESVMRYALDGMQERQQGGDVISAVMDLVPSIPSVSSLMEMIGEGVRVVAQGSNESPTATGVQPLRYTAPLYPEDDINVVRPHTHDTPQETLDKIASTWHQNHGGAVPFMRNNTPPAEATYFGFIVLRNGLDEYSMCSATLVSPRHALTTASCVLRKGYEEKMYRTVGVFGEEDIGPSLLRTGEVLYNHPRRNRVKRTVFHPMHRYGTRQYDLAVLEFMTDVEAADPIKLARPGIDLSNEPLTFMGHGARPSPSLRFSSYRQYLSFISGKLVPHDECAEEYKASFSTRLYPKEDLIRNDILCVRSAPGVQLCEGDQGGPLVMNFVDMSKPPLLVGIAAGNDHNCIGQRRLDIGLFPDLAVRLTDATVKFIRTVTSDIDFKLVNRNYS